MPSNNPEIATLQGKLARLQLVTLAMGAGMAAVLISGAGSDPVQDEIKARRIALVDSRGVERIVMGEDAGRQHGRSAAMWIFDESGAERGGMGTFENGRASMAFDAPVGVGDQRMRDRVGMAVDAKGAASIQLNNNDTGVPIRLVTDEAGGGGLELIQFDHQTKTAHIKRLSYAGETIREVPFGGRAAAAAAQE